VTGVANADSAQDAVHLTLTKSSWLPSIKCMDYGVCHQDYRNCNFTGSSIQMLFSVISRPHRSSAMVSPFHGALAQ